ncbi:hypothetical protein HNR42_002070 [Deinobacterium chartae]|uniref:PELOTA RNA-binding domain-containing protein n=1 Tax=Deinobacterium chartae TaxID=521158 RepID=A0A841I400_9DEIO|nr:cysteine protease StiP family protein [Deinobacterium chartae]MBB6098635.1 hypothetical protein [Deinobacterium chartae]
MSSAEPAALRPHSAGFSGSYAPDDVTFLLDRVQPDFTDVLEKERLIQAGERHYGELLSPEPAPDAAYLEVFERAVERNGARLAADLRRLAVNIQQQRPDGITLVSLARGGTPVGVLLGRILRELHGLAVRHYSVSIIRDHGVDTVALRQILEAGHAPESLVFVDGWTGKGVIARELERSVRAFNAVHDLRLDPGLFAVADLCGAAAVSATADDYLIPSAVLNATVSGLISRSLLPARPGARHGAALLSDLAAWDRSRAFVDAIWARVPQADLAALPLPDRAALRGRSAAFLDEAARRWNAEWPNFVKPGVGEATRVLLRRVPERLLLRESDHPDTEHLRHLAAAKGVPVEIVPDLPYRATALIRSLSEGA